MLDVQIVNARVVDGTAASSRSVRASGHAGLAFEGDTD